MTEKEMLLQAQDEVLSMPPQETGFEGLYSGHNFWNTYSESLSDLDHFYKSNDRDAEISIENHMIEYAAKKKLLTGREVQKTAYETFDMSSECNIGRNISAAHRAAPDNLFNKTTKIEKIFGQKRQGASLAKTKYEMIKRESDLVGSKLFGVVPEGHKREFYCLDEHTWVWYEQWKEDGAPQRRMVRYEVLENKVTKNIDGVYKKVGEAELANLRQAMHLYYTEIMHKIYKVDPYTGQSLA